MNEADPRSIWSAPPAPPGTANAQERTWGMWAHLSALLGGLLTSGRGGSVGFFIGPLIVWLIKKDTMPFVNDQGKEALNFAITVSLACLALLLMTLATLGVGGLLAFPLMAVIGLTALVLIIIAAGRANQGIAYRYPFSLRLVK
ncbi:MAG TPA: DUF4870 domain-containing protein [Steroidobacteraceae bacterium]